MRQLATGLGLPKGSSKSSLFCLAALKLGERVNLAGVSYGGWLTALFALRFPARLNKAVLLAPAGTVLRFSARFLTRVGLGAAGGGWGLSSLFRWMFADFARNHPKRFEELVARNEIASRSVDRRNYLLPAVWTDAEWASLRVPTLFLVGEHETIYSPDKAVRRLKKVAPQVRTEIIAGAGHDLTIVQAETINRLIISFLAQETAASQV